MSHHPELPCLFQRLSPAEQPLVTGQGSFSGASLGNDRRACGVVCRLACPIEGQTHDHQQSGYRHSPGQGCYPPGRPARTTPGR